jgi:hypothetical protein
MAGRTGGTDIHGVAEVNRVLARIAREDLTEARGRLREGTQQIAERHAMPMLREQAERSGVPIAPIMAATMRARKDRIITIRVGAVNPKGLSGYRSRSAGNGKNYRTNLALGSNYGPRQGARVNNYGIGRSPGRWVQPTLKDARTWNRIKGAYEDLLSDILRQYGRT